MSYYDLGALPGGFTRDVIKGFGGRRSTPSPSFRDPRIQVGPFNFDARGSSYRFTQKQWGTPEFGEVRNWVRTSFGQIDKSYYLSCRIMRDQEYSSTAVMAKQILEGLCVSKWETWEAGTAMIPPVIWKGKRPVARTKHPITGKWWGVFIKFGSGDFVVTFKELPRSWLKKLWDAITAVVSFIIDTVKAMIDLFKLVACVIAQQNLDMLSRFASGEIELTDVQLAKYKKMGLSKAQIDQLRTKPTSAGTALIGKTVAAAICGPTADPAIGALEEGIPGWVWIVATAVGVGGLGYWALKKARI